MKHIVSALAVAVILFSPLVSSALSVGDEAPVFEAESTHGKIRLEDFRGKKNVVLAFYFADFTPV